LALLFDGPDDICLPGGNKSDDRMWMNQARVKPITTWLGGTFMVDAHVHCHAGVAPACLLHHAAANITAAAARRDVRPAAGWLLFTEMADDDAFSAFERAATAAGVDGWRIRQTDESVSLIAERPADFPLILVAGRQIVTAEGLEVLAIGARGPFADGQDLGASVAAVRAADGLAVLPWGFGKWWGRRGAVVEDFIARATPGSLFLGDNGGRLRSAPRPAAFATAAARGIPVLPGSDPLPLDAEATTAAGRYGFVLEAVVDASHPADGLKARLAALREQPESFGSRQSLLPFVSRQLAMQWRKWRRVQ
jgi:hypothetical protein